MHKIQKAILLFIFFGWTLNVVLAAPSHKPVHHIKTQLHKTKNNPKAASHSHKKNNHLKTKKKTSIIKPRIVKPHTVKTHIIKTHIIKPHIVKKDSSSYKQPIVASNPVTKTSSYRILTQPFPSEYKSSAPVLNSQSRPGFAATFEHKLVDFVHKTISSLRYSTYKLGGSHFDATQGIYIVDCSGYVDHTLRAVYPNAYLNLVDSTGANKPNTSHYYNFFTNLDNDSNQYWSRVEDIEKLRAGDILVFRYKNNRGKSTGGHVMVVMDKPERDGDAYLVSVTDSAASGHSEDTRQNHVSGIGIGTILLKVDPKTRQPSAYAWTFNSPWKRNVSFAMGRPLDSWTSKMGPPHETSRLET